ncbi:hypothetical protein QOT17_023997 [Balamuthia mandrillaris]
MHGSHYSFLLLLLELLLLSQAAARVGFFDAAGSNVDPSCPETDPCSDLGRNLRDNEFDEYVLAAGTYYLNESIPFSQSVTIRKWVERMEDDDPLIIFEEIDGFFCFHFNTEVAAASVLRFTDLVVVCPDKRAFHFDSSQPQLVFEWSDVAIRDSGAALYIRSTHAQKTWEVSTSGLLVQNVSCDTFGTAVAVYNLYWTFADLTFISSCYDGIHGVMDLNDAEAKSDDGGLLFQHNHPDASNDRLIMLFNSKLITERVPVQFVDNSATYLVLILGDSKWWATGQISFVNNTGRTALFQVGLGTPAQKEVYSLYPLHLEGNQGPTFVSMDPNTAYVCAIPCEGDCDCNDRPVLSFNISSSSSSSENQTLVFASSQSSFVLPLTLGTPSPFDFQLPLHIELSNGLLYDEHLVFAPPPTPPPTGPLATTLNVTVDILQNQTEVPFIITRLPTLQEEGTITIRVTPELFNSSSYASFFLPVDYMLMVKVQPAALSFDAANRTFRSSHASIAVSFPNANKPDYTISLFNESHPLANSSVSAEFISLMEINEEGEVVSIASLQETSFGTEELGNTSFNLNNALPFISFSALISSLTINDADKNTKKLVNLTEAIEMSVEFTLFAESQAILFAGVEQVMEANTLKWNLFLSSWPFQHRNHSLQLYLFISSEGGPVLARSEETAKENGVWKLQLRTDNVEIPVNVLPLALVSQPDETPQEETVSVNAEWLGEEQILMIEMPFFGGSLLLDPDMSLLLASGEEEKADGEDESDDSLWWKIVVPVLVVGAVVVVVAVAVLGTVVIKKRSKRRRETVMGRLAIYNNSSATT